jgi:tyrosine-protein kinase Etk/Wzc
MSANILNGQKDWAVTHIYLLDMIAVIGVKKGLILGVSVLAGLVAVVATMFLTPVYTARTTLIVPFSGDGVLASLEEEEGFIDIGQDSATVETFVRMLESQSAKDKIIDRFGLLVRFKTGSREDVYTILDKNVRVFVDKKSNLIVLEFDDRDAEFAAKVANGYYEVLLDLQRRVVTNESRQRIVFIERQLNNVKENLANAELAFKETQEKTGVVVLKSQMEAVIESIALLSAEVARSEVQLSTMRTFAAPGNSEYRRVAAELSGFRAQLSKLEKGISDGSSDFASFGNLPEQSLQYARALRNVKYYEAIFDIMAKQVGLAKIDQVKDLGNIQQLDVAVKPEKPGKPKHILIVSFSMLAGGFFTVLYLLILDAYITVAKSPKNIARLNKLANSWKIGR